MPMGVPGSIKRLTERVYVPRWDPFLGRAVFAAFSVRIFYQIVVVAELAQLHSTGVTRPQFFRERIIRIKLLCACWAGSDKQQSGNKQLRHDGHPTQSVVHWQFLPDVE